MKQSPITPPIGPSSGSDAARRRAQLEGIPGPCPLCGGVTLAPATQRSILLGVANVLVYKALEKLGSSIVRQERGRFNELGERPKYIAHTIWTPKERDVAKALISAWDVVPALLDVHGCDGVTSDEITAMLDEYVRDLAITGTSHSIEELMYRFEDRLSLPVFNSLAATMNGAVHVHS